MSDHGFFFLSMMYQPARAPRSAGADTRKIAEPAIIAQIRHSSISAKYQVHGRFDLTKQEAPQACRHKGGDHGDYTGDQTEDPIFH